MDTKYFRRKSERMHSGLNLAVWAAGVAVLFHFIPPAAQADVKLPSLISDHMVLQADLSTHVWGWATPGEVVKVTINGQPRQALTDANHRWKVTLDPMPPGGPYVMTVQGNNRIDVQDVLVGEVWLCSGQSNMEMPVLDALNGSKEAAQANNPFIRLFTVAQTAAPEEQEDVPGRWVVATPSEVENFTAAGYYFGRRLAKDLNRPVGLIEAAWGGSLVESWMALRSLRMDPEFESILDRFKRAEALMPDFMVRHEEQMKAWEKAAKQAEDTNEDIPREPWVPRSLRVKRLASYLFNGMINPLTNYRIRGVLWYQGESNAVRGEQYRKLLLTLIGDWRQRWGESQLPFIVVQIANYLPQRRDPNSPSAWAELRESQFVVAKHMPNVGLVVTIDIGDEVRIHPLNKQDVGYRAALWARSQVYGDKELVHSGPEYRSMRRVGQRIELSFRHTGSGLVSSEEKLLGFAVAGDDQVFHWAHAEIQGDKVIVWTEDVTDPVAVRYAWANNPNATLYNHEGLPASPFRTDDWTGLTTGKD